MCHHGWVGRRRTRDETLREHIRETAVVLVRDEGVDALTTRHLADRSGASLAAINELFGSRRGLVDEVAGQGFVRLAAVYAAVPRTEDPHADLHATAAAFRQFASTERHLFEVMFSRPFAAFAPSGHEARAAADIRAEVVARVAALLGTDPEDPATTDAALGLVALTRGLAAQELAGILGSNAASARRRWTAAVDAHLAGLSVIHTRGSAA